MNAHDRQATLGYLDEALRQMEAMVEESTNKAGKVVRNRGRITESFSRFKGAASLAIILDHSESHLMELDKRSQRLEAVRHVFYGDEYF